MDPHQIDAFFEGWPDPPTPETHVALPLGSDVVVLAVDSETHAVVGFITAITDGVIAAYIPLLEVASRISGAGHRQGARPPGAEPAEDLYMVDVVCDADVSPFYESMGFGACAMIRRPQRRRG